MWFIKPFDQNGLKSNTINKSKTISHCHSPLNSKNTKQISVSHWANLTLHFKFTAWHMFALTSNFSTSTTPQGWPTSCRSRRKQIKISICLNSFNWKKNNIKTYLQQIHFYCCHSDCSYLKSATFFLTLFLNRIKSQSTNVILADWNVLLIKCAMWLQNHYHHFYTFVWIIN